MRENYLSSEEALERLVEEYPGEAVHYGRMCIGLGSGLGAFTVVEAALVYNRVNANIAEWVEIEKKVRLLRTGPAYQAQPN
jgi:hypothetical protein